MIAHLFDDNQAFLPCHLVCYTEQMLSAEIKNKLLDEPEPHHLWANDPATAKIRRTIILFWVRSSILTWILILLVALIYLGSGRVRFITYLTVRKITSYT